MFYDVRKLTPGSKFTIKGVMQGTPIDGYLVFSVVFSETPGCAPEGWTTLCDATVTFQVPETYQAIAEAMKSAELMKEDALKKYNEAVALIDKRIAEFLALEN